MMKTSMRVVSFNRLVLGGAFCGGKQDPLAWDTFQDVTAAVDEPNA